MGTDILINLIVVLLSFVLILQLIDRRNYATKKNVQNTLDTIISTFENKLDIYNNNLIDGFVQKNILSIKEELAGLDKKIQEYYSKTNENNMNAFNGLNNELKTYQDNMENFTRQLTTNNEQKYKVMSKITKDSILKIEQELSKNTDSIMDIKSVFLSIKNSNDNNAENIRTLNEHIKQNHELVNKYYLAYEQKYDKYGDSIEKISDTVNMYLFKDIISKYDLELKNMLKEVDKKNTKVSKI